MRGVGGAFEQGRAPGKEGQPAHILLLADKKKKKEEEGWTDKAIAKALHTSQSTVECTRRRFVECGGLEHAPNEAPRPGGQRRLTGEQEACLLALASSDPPEGKKRWTMQLLADRMVELEVVGSPISDGTVRRTLKRGL